MRGTTPTETMATYHACKSTANGRTAHIDFLPLLENFDGQLGSRRIFFRGLLIHTQFPEVAARLRTSLGKVTPQWFGHPAGPTRAGGQLERRVPISGLLLDLGYTVRFDLNYCYGHRDAFIAEHASHANFFSNKSQCHLQLLPDLSLLSCYLCLRALAELDLDVHPSREVQFHKRIYSFICRFDNIHNSFVNADLELVA